MMTKHTAPYFFCLPFVISFSVFMVYPMIDMVYRSFYKLEGVSTYRFVGLDNYDKILSDPHIGNAVWNTVWFTVGITVVNLALPLFLAIALNNRLTPLRNLFRSAFFIPALTSVVVAGIYFRLFFAGNPDTPLNWLARVVGLGARDWLNAKETGVIALVLTSTWRWLGLNILYFLAALQTIPRELYEAAHVDGANAVRRFLYVTLPGIKPILIFVTTVMVYGGFRMFGESYVLWNGKSPGDIGLTIVLYVYRTAFGYFDMGYASAISVVFFIFLMVVNLVYIKSMGFLGGRRKG
jgi:arabinosaccharide transport system permease protein